MVYYQLSPVIVARIRHILFIDSFFSSSRRHTIWTGDWSSDVCSSDLCVAGIYVAHELYHHLEATGLEPAAAPARVTLARLGRWRWESGIRALSEIAAHAFAQALLDLEIGRASCRGRGCRAGVGGPLRE